MRRLLTVILDGVGERQDSAGNAVLAAYTPNLDYLRTHCPYTQLKAHGPYVGLPGLKDQGNSEVGHMTLGAGRVFPQGAKLVEQCLSDGSIFKGKVWQDFMDCSRNGGTLHFIGLLSDGGVHAQERHLWQLLTAAAKGGAKRLRIHPLWDGRDVKPDSAEIYLERLENVLEGLSCDAKIASGGGRMQVTMDRYEANWGMVQKGWEAHVLGLGPSYSSAREAIQAGRVEGLDDQNLPAFVIVESGEAVGKIQDGDGVVFFNYRGDRAIEISQAFTETEEDFRGFPRKSFPKVFYAGMIAYDMERKIPPNYLVTPSRIDSSLGEHLADLGLKQFACSETQKFGHVTYFWNGNRADSFDARVEEYLEINSSASDFDARPWMQAEAICRETLVKIADPNGFAFARINFANGDMVGHTGNFPAAVLAMSSIDLMLGRLLVACKKNDVILVVTADHGNCEDMFQDKRSSWEPFQDEEVKTSHTIAAVPFMIFDPRGKGYEFVDMSAEERSLASFANTALDLMGLERRGIYKSSLIRGGG